MLGGLLVAWFAFRAGAPVSRAPAAAGGPQLKVTYWNLEWFPGQKPNAPEAARAAHVAAVLPVVERLNPDLLGLEEVADADAARLLTDHLAGFKVDVCSDFTEPGAPNTIHQQVVLSSRLPLIQGWSEPWAARADGWRPPRGFAFAAYRLPGGAILLAYGVHLKSNRAGGASSPELNIAEREEASRQLIAHAHAMAASYAKLGKVALILLGGDMNTSLDDPRFAAETTLRAFRGDGFRWAWEATPESLRLTLPAEGRYPSSCFDHIFYRGDGVRLSSCSMEPTGREQSDHRPVTAIFLW